MVFVSVLIAAEKLIPWPRPANYAITGLLLALGLGIALVPHRVPGLTLPDSPQAISRMSQMHGPHSGAGTMPAMR
jgi:hypothetical protein